MDNSQSIMYDPYQIEQKANQLEYNRFQKIGRENVGQPTNVIPIEVDLPRGIRTPDQVGNLLLQTARNQNTMQVADEGQGINPFRDIMTLNSPDTLSTGKAIIQKFQQPEQLKDDNVIFKYVPLNKLSSNTSEKSYYYNSYSIFLVSLLAFIICYYDNIGCESTERILKSIVASLLGIIYIFAYLIKYTLVKC